MRVHVLVVATVAALTAVCATATAANASRPIPLPPGPDVTWPAGTLCSYPLRIVTTEDKSLLHEFSNGQILITGKLTQRVTNLDTGVSHAFKASGPLRVIFHDDGTSTVISIGRVLITLSSAATPVGRESSSTLAASSIRTPPTEPSRQSVGYRTASTSAPRSPNFNTLQERTVRPA